MPYIYLGPQTPHPDLHQQLNSGSFQEVAVDVETISVEDRTPLGIGFATNPGEAFYFTIDDGRLPWHLLTNKAITKIFHNGHFDLGVIKQHKGIDVAPVKDSLIAAQLLGYPASLHNLALELFNSSYETIQDLIGKGVNAITMAQVPLEKVAHKCCMDVRYSLATWWRLRDQVPQEAYQLEIDVMPILAAMEERGIAVDKDKLVAYKNKMYSQLNYFRTLGNGMGFNPGSSQQVASILRGRGHSIRYKRTTGKPILNEDMLSTLYRDDPIVQMVLEYRHTQTLYTHHIRKLLEEYLVEVEPNHYRVYSRIHQIATNSGRLSRSKPNLQNITHPLRDIFLPSPGNILEDWDLSQIELRDLAYWIASCLGDYDMQDVYEKGGDIHEDTAIQMWGPTAKGNPVKRRTAKIINFGVIYGADEHTLYQKTGIPLEQGKQFIQRLFEVRPGIRKFIESVEGHLYTEGYTATRLGRRRRFPGIHQLSPYHQAAARREAFNHVIQGSSAEVAKKLMLKVATEPQVNAVHDSISLDINPAYNLDREVSIGIAPYRTPIEVKQGNNWRDQKKIGVYG